MKQRTNIHKLTLALLLCNSLHSTSAMRNSEDMADEINIAPLEIASEVTLKNSEAEEKSSLIPEDKPVMSIDDYIKKMNIEDDQDELGNIKKDETLDMVEADLDVEPVQAANPEDLIPTSLENQNAELDFVNPEDPLILEVGEGKEDLDEDQVED